MGSLSDSLLLGAWAGRLSPGGSHVQCVFVSWPEEEEPGRGRGRWWKAWPEAEPLGVF